MIQIRSNVFETNSSSTHSFTICSDEEYQKLLASELFIGYEGKLTKSSEDGTSFEEWKRQQGYCSEIDINETFTTKSGDIVHAFGYFGHD